MEMIFDVDANGGRSVREKPGVQQKHVQQEGLEVRGPTAYCQLS